MNKDDLEHTDSIYFLNFFVVKRKLSRQKIQITNAINLNRYNRWTVI